MPWWVDDPGSPDGVRELSAAEIAERVRANAARWQRDNERDTKNRRAIERALGALGEAVIAPERERTVTSRLDPAGEVTAEHDPGIEVAGVVAYLERQRERLTTRWTPADLCTALAAMSGLSDRQIAECLPDLAGGVRGDPTGRVRQRRHRIGLARPQRRRL